VRGILASRSVRVKLNNGRRRPARGTPCARNNVKWVMKGGAVAADKTEGQVR
jgi:hypothetical protein